MCKRKIDVVSDRGVSFPNWLIILGMPTLFFLWNCGKYDGPAFLADEIGYLANAIFLSGHWIDGGSSYHAGFSLLLAPLFLIFDDTAMIWKGAMLINSFLWGLTFYFANKLIVDWDARILPARRAIILLLLSLYPTWVTMSGYVFTTSAFVTLFMGGLLCLIKAIRNRGKGLYFFTIWVGLLYWVHPIGLMAVGASIIAIGVWGLQERRLLRVWLFHTIGSLSLVVIYKYLLHPALLDAMTPEGHNPLTHYPSLAIILGKIQSLDFWLQLSVHSLGQVSYFLVGSFGVAVFGIHYLVQNTLMKSERLSARWKVQVALYMIGTLVGVISLGAINFSVEVTTGKLLDNWIYGRYLDSVCMPILIVSLIAFMEAGWKARLSLLSPCLLIVVLTGYLLHIDHEVYPPNTHNVIVNTVAFWPQYVFSGGAGLWMLIGAVGIILTYLSGIIGFCLLALILLVLSLTHQTEFHKGILAEYSAPTALAEIVRENYNSGAPISFDWDSSAEKSWFHKERFSLYKYYLYNYRYQRVSKEGWESDCSDLILTYHAGKYADLGIEIARESRSGLSLVKKKSDHTLKISESTPNYGIILKGDDRGSLPERISFYAEDLVKMSQVGKVLGGSLVSDNQSGYLFFGPYIHLSKGDYRLTIYGDFSRTNDATFDIVGNAGRVVFLREKLAKEDDGPGEISFDFSLPDDASGLEVRLLVADQDRIAVTRYLIQKK